MTNIGIKCTAANERFGATAAGRAGLKGCAGKPPLRQAAIPLAASGDDDVIERNVPKRKYNVHPDRVVDKAARN